MLNTAPDILSDARAALASCRPLAGLPPIAWSAWGRSSPSSSVMSRRSPTRRSAWRRCRRRRKAGDLRCAGNSTSSRHLGMPSAALISGGIPSSRTGLATACPCKRAGRGDSAMIWPKAAVSSVRRYCKVAPSGSNDRAPRSLPISRRTIAISKHTALETPVGWGFLRCLAGAVARLFGRSFSGGGDGCEDRPRRFFAPQVVRRAKPC